LCPSTTHVDAGVSRSAYAPHHMHRREPPNRSKSQAVCTVGDRASQWCLKPVSPEEAHGRVASSIQMEVHAVDGNAVGQSLLASGVPSHEVLWTECVGGVGLLTGASGSDVASPATGGVIVDDRRLVAQLRAGESHAMGLLFQRYYDVLCAFAAMYTKSIHTAEEVVDDLFFHLWTTRDQLDVRDNVKSYLYAATRNRALNWVRHERASQRLLDLADPGGGPPGMGEEQPRTDAALHDGELQRAVEDAMSRLPPRCRQVFLLHRQHRLTYVEIAGALDISPRTVENLIARALRHLRRNLGALLRD
jgi:RNA polymerase sigma-70 factor (ECF subfamily)